MKFCICKTTGQKFHDSHFPGDCPTSGPLPPSKISQGGGSSCWCDSGRGRGGEKRVVTAANDGALTCRRCEISVCFVLLHLKNESCFEGHFFLNSFKQDHWQRQLCRTGEGAGEPPDGAGRPARTVHRDPPRHEKAGLSMSMC